ncbi:MAG: retropepsin-like aspartic protease [Terriglobales bacterium]
MSYVQRQPQPPNSQQPGAPPSATQSSLVPMNAFILATNALESQDFQSANDGCGQVLHRKWPLGTQPAIMALDTGCAKCIISQQFLDKFNVPSSFFKSVQVQVDNGTSRIPIQHSIVLPVTVSGFHIATDFLVVPSLPTPLDALLSWSWGRNLQVVLDFASNDLQMKVPPPASALVAPDYHQLLPINPTLATSDPAPATSDPIA